MYVKLLNVSEKQSDLEGRDIWMMEQSAEVPEVVLDWELIKNVLSSNEV